jgi:hypothetical protein
MIDDFAIFVFGCIVTLFVSAAVGILIYGAHQERDVD